MVANLNTVYPLCAIVIGLPKAVVDIIGTHSCTLVESSRKEMSSTGAIEVGRVAGYVFWPRRGVFVNLQVWN